ncbi:MAG: GumC family protein [Mangrovibacterium sp.]
MRKIENFSNTLEKEDSVAIKKFLHRLLRNSLWLLLSVCIGVLAAIVITKSLKPAYHSKALLLIKEEADPNVMKEGTINQVLTKDINIKNHIGVLKSFSLNKQVLDNLDWATTWYRTELFRDKELYGDEPFIITMHREEANVYHVPIYISMVDSLTYRVKVNDSFIYNGVRTKVNISETKKFGEAFNNKYFNFTVWKKEQNPKGTFYFIFNDSHDQTVDYTSKLEVDAEESTSNLINIGLVDTNPKKSADYVNELCKVFIQFGLIEKNRKSSSTVKFIDNQLSGVIDTLNETGRDFTSFRTRNQIINIGQEGDLIMQKLGQLETERSEEQARMTYYENLNRYMTDKEKMQQIIAPSVVGITDPTLTSLVTRLTDLYNRREVLSYSVQEKNPTLLLVNNEIAMSIQTLKENLSNLLNNSRITISNLDRRISGMRAQLQAYPKTEQELMSIQRSFDLNNELYTYLLKKRAEAAITHASNVSDAQVIDQAEENTAIIIGPKPIFNIIVGGLAGLTLPIFFMLIGSYFNDRINSAEEIEQLTSLQIVGNIVNNSHRKELIPVIKYPRSALAESFRELRTNLRFLYSHENSKVISINSVIPREGKSFTAVNLASMIAMNSMKVLLIDCDLRKPGLHKQFGCQNYSGLSTYLITQHEQQDIIQTTKIENLYLVAGGPVPPNPSEILETGRLERLIQDARKEYDYIIIDNAPLSLVSDGIIISQFTDVNLFVLRQDYSKKGEVRFINHMHVNKSMKNAGIILNDIHIRKHAQVGYYGAQYIYKHNYGYDYYLEAT